MSFKDTSIKQQEYLRKQRDILAYRMKKLSAKQEHFVQKTAELKEKIKKKYDDMKRVLDEDLRITMCQLDMEQEAMERTTEESIEKCFQLRQELEQQLSETAKQLDQDKVHDTDQIAETDKRLLETLKITDPESIQMDEFKSEQLLCLTINLLLFIRSQIPVTKKLFQSYAQEVVLNPDSAHPKLIVSPAGDSVTYTDTWQEVPENPSRFDTTLNVISQEGFEEGRNYWEVQVSGKTYWELGLTYPSIPRKGREEQCWLGRGPDSCSFGGLVCFLGSDTMTPLYSFCVGTFTDALYQAVCPGHDNQGTNWKPLLICDASKSAPTL
ncbi:Zinc-binding protein A33 [Bagarius yarrelli]|uniref:Zinc-binding protein A33 n=1 Tax=Bagarius yarrelli TaxID=175774 RepID=A0A556TJ41_BAGYA|nr:Zinc-binding protein A33 [Bagarius yarrelli]